MQPASKLVKISHFNQFLVEELFLTGVVKKRLRRLGITISRPVLGVIAIILGTLLRISSACRVPGRHFPHHRRRIATHGLFGASKSTQNGQPCFVAARSCSFAGSSIWSTASTCGDRKSLAILFLFQNLRTAIVNRLAFRVLPIKFSGGVLIVT